MVEQKKILVVAAHPDDEVLGCGGTSAKLAKEGHAVYSLILGEGLTSRDEKRDVSKRKKELIELKRQIRNANTILGVKKQFIFNFPDNRFDSVALLDIVKVIEKTKKDINPDVVFTHHHGDLNIDHQITFKAVMTAFRPLNSETVREIYSFEVPSSTEWSMPSSSTYFMPNYFVDISKTLELKIKAMKEYKSELKDFPHPRSLQGIRLNAQNWGMRIGCRLAEAFQAVRIIH